ncbi:hypothetical protein HII31_04492 [Pseudocercospora fuligena]|uniref:Uncharacterized protein n=1 Tax=Pseudocercospora fuligena TaxID=685502 RepID=A0A8H6VPJ5_9PEZI|nr:hypothetical protein HII31_04492 [Pseudocercospora fuligena]
MPAVEIFVAQAIFGLTLFGYAWLAGKRDLHDWSKPMYGEPWPRPRVALEDYVRRIKPAADLKPQVHDRRPFSQAPEVRAYYARLDLPTPSRFVSTYSGPDLGASDLPPLEPDDDRDWDLEYSSKAGDSDSESPSEEDDKSDDDDEEKKRRKKAWEKKQKNKARRTKKPDHKNQPTRKEESHGPRPSKHGKGRHQTSERSGLRGGGDEEEHHKFYDGGFAYFMTASDPAIPVRLDEVDRDNKGLLVEIYPRPPFGPRPWPKPAPKPDKPES